MWGVIKLLKLAEVSKKYIQKVTNSTTTGHQFFKKMSKERLVELSSACRRKAVWNYRKLTHADWCSSKCGVENLGNFEEHWAKAESKNSISHWIYDADNLPYAHKYFALVF